MSTIDARIIDFIINSGGGGGGDVTKAYVDQQIANHNHNGIYYTKQEVDTKIAEIPSGGGGGGGGDILVRNWQKEYEIAPMELNANGKAEYIDTHTRISRWYYHARVPIYPNSRITGVFSVTVNIYDKYTREFDHTFGDVVENCELCQDLTFEVGDLEPDKYIFNLDNIPYDINNEDDIQFDVEFTRFTVYTMKPTVPEDLFVEGKLGVKSSADIAGSLNVNSDVNIGNGAKLKMDGYSSDGYGPTFDCGYLRFANGNETDHKTYIRMNIGDKSNLMWFSEAGVKISKTAGSQTITHQTNIQGEIGTFCETNGGIYDGYEKIDTTDCICQVKQSTTLNAKIVGVITSENQFASHGDVLMKVVPGTYKLGDILCPDSTGKARIATETELQYMMLHAIPRPKITSLNTGIANTVACFVI